MLSLRLCVLLLPLLALSGAINVPQQQLSVDIPLENLLQKFKDNHLNTNTHPHLIEKILEKVKADQGQEEASRSSVDIQPYIIEGYQVQGVDNAPHLVSLSLSSVAYAHFCAGSIIFKSWLLTAAHCVQELTELNGGIIGTPIYAGITNRSNVTGAQIREVDFASIHRSFTGVAGSADIALLHVSQPFVLSARVQPITLPDNNEDYSNKTTIAYGWGLTDVDGDEYSKELQYAFATLLSSPDCVSELPSDAPLTSSQVCAQIKVCYGDGGTPLVYWPIDGPAELVGLGSWSYMPCGYGNRPAVFTSVSSYVSWILQVISAYYQLNK
ncbi:trypsin [Drosophila tropicalis]|uniref:trypsin n=1 Tax=Drosophila tropicalis TaxID=46794 RepID=UPI0035ABB507